MKVMVVEEGEGELFFVVQALEALGAEVVRSPSLDEDKVIVHKIDIVVHIWSEFTADVESVQVQALYEVDPDLMVIIFAPTNDVAMLRRKFRKALVADKRALDAASAARTAEAAVRELRQRRAEVATPA